MTLACDSERSPARMGPDAGDRYRGEDGGRRVRGGYANRSQGGDAAATVALPAAVEAATMWGVMVVGIIKDAKAKSIGEQAARAVAEGRSVFACRVNEGGWNDNWGGSLSGVAEQIEAVEAAGWSLDKASFLPGKGQNVSAFLIFRRAQAAPMQQSYGAVPQPYNGGMPPTPTWGQQS